MIALDEDSLICDLAETYGIYDYRSLPARTVATLSVGLRKDSRIMKKMSGRKISEEMMLLSAIYDKLSVLVWFQTEDGQNGENRPKSMLRYYLGMDEEDNNDVQGFSNPDDFERKRRELIGE